MKYQPTRNHKMFTFYMFLKISMDSNTHSHTPRMCSYKQLKPISPNNINIAMLTIALRHESQPMSRHFWGKPPDSANFVLSANVHLASRASLSRVQLRHKHTYPPPTMRVIYVKKMYTTRIGIHKSVRSYVICIRLANTK